MTFLQPWMLWGLLGASVPIIIHLIHRRRPRRQPFAAIELLLRSADRVDKRWRLQRILLLAARVLLLALLALAAARPTPEATGQPAASAGPRRVGIVVDVSASMQARYDERTAFERALRRARSIVNDLGPEDLAVVVTAGTEAALSTPEPTADRRRLREAVDAVEPSAGRGDLGRATTLAVRALDPGEQASDVPVEVAVLSDWAESAVQTPADVSLQAGGRARVELIDVLEEVDDDARDNGALTSVQVEPSPSGQALALRFLVRTRSFAPTGGDRAPRALDLVVGEGAVETSLVEIAPGTIADQVVEHAFEEPGVKLAEVRIAPDRLTLDDRFFVVARVRPRVRTLVVDGDPSGVAKEDEVFYFDKAARAGLADHPVPRIVTTDQLAGVDLSAYEVVVLAGLVTLPAAQGQRLSNFVEGGGGLLVAVGPDTDARALSDALPVLPRALRGLKMLGDVAGSSQPLALAPPDLGHPIFEVFRGEGLGGLESTRTRGIALLEPGGGTMAVPLRFEDGQPAMVTSEVGRGRVALWASSLDRDLTDFPIRPAFLPWVRRTVLWLGRGLAERDERPTVVGETHPIEVARDAGFVRVRGPRGDERTVPVTGGIAAFEGTDAPGHYRVFSADGAPLEAAHFAVNVDAAESDLRPMRLEDAELVLIGGAGSSANAASSLRALALDDGWTQEFGVTLLLALMAATFLLESLLTTRRIGRA